MLRVQTLHQNVVRICITESQADAVWGFSSFGACCSDGNGVGAIFQQLKPEGEKGKKKKKIMDRMMIQLSV